MDRDRDQLREQLRARLQARVVQRPEPVCPAPQYDEAFARGVAWLDSDGSELKSFRVQVLLPTLGMVGTCDVVSTRSTVYWLVLDHFRSVTGAEVEPEFDFFELKGNDIIEDTSSERIVAWTMKTLR